MAIYDASYEKYKRRLQMPPSDESRVNTERDVRADDSTSKRARESFEQFRLRNVSSAHIFRFPMVEGAFGRANVRPRARYRPKWEAFTVAACAIVAVDANGSLVATAEVLLPSKIRTSPAAETHAIAIVIRPDAALHGD